MALEDRYVALPIEEDQELLAVFVVTQTPDGGFDGDVRYYKDGMTGLEKSGIVVTSRGLADSVELSIELEEM